MLMTQVPSGVYAAPLFNLWSATAGQLAWSWVVSIGFHLAGVRWNFVV